MKVGGEELHYSGKWINLKSKTYIDKQGTEKKWSYVERIREQKAVVIIPHTEETNSLILIRQYRIPFEREVVEFPAGLIDPGENPIEAAVRELLEETGFHGRVLETGPEVCSSAGLTTETLYMVYMRVKESPRLQTTEASENITVVKLAENDFYSFLMECKEKNILMDSKVYVYLATRTGIPEG